MGFWILAGLMVLIAVLVIGYAMVSPGHAQTDEASSDLGIYRDQLAELDRDVARGVVAAEDAERSRIEISRRLLEADKQAQAAARARRAPRAASVAAITACLALLAGGGVWLYAGMGAPGYWDMPLSMRIAASEEQRRTRPDQSAAEADMPLWDGPPEGVPEDYLDLVAQLRDAVAQRPGDAQGQALLATHEAALGNYPAAHVALSRAIAAKGDAATADDWAQYADLLVLAAGGYVSPEAEQALTQALRRDPENGIARYYSGLMFMQLGRPDTAFRLWSRLLETSGPEDPWTAPIRARIEELAAMAGVRYALPETTGGPSAADIAAAEDMTPEARAEMIDGMVAGLMDRLASQGGTSDEWARLIGALAVQGRMDEAASIYAEALDNFATSAADVARLRAAADAAGLPDPSAPALPGLDPDSAEARALDNRATMLADELGTSGGTAERWLELIEVLMALDEPELAQRRLTDARRGLAGDAAALERLNAGAEDLGVEG